MFNEKLLRLSLIFIAFLIVLGTITINFILNDSKTPQYTDSPKQAKINNMSTDSKELSLDTLFIPIRSEKYKILKADFALKLSKESDKKALQNNMNNVRSTILQYLASIDANKLGTPKGKEALKEEIISLLQETFGYEIETIYFKNFILSP